MASRSIQPFLQGHERDRQSDHVTRGRIYVRCTAMRTKMPN